MSVHKEVAFEDAIERALLDSGWERGLHDGYDRELALDTDQLFTFIGATQQDQWDRLIEFEGGDQDATQQKFAQYLAREIDTHGALDVLRHGVKDRGVLIRLAYFRPAHTLADDALVQYEQNRLSVIRQLRYSAKTPDRSLDLVLFVNGVPVATAELKNPLTGQTVEHAKAQYRKDRDPRELIFARRTLVHFAVDPDLVFITTRLAGEKTRFLPFNMGSEGPGVSRRRREPASRSTATARRTCGSRCGSRTPGWTLFGASCTSRSEEHGQGRPARAAHDLPAVPPVARGPRADRARRRARRRTQLPGPALGRLRQVEHHRLAGHRLSHTCTTDDERAGLRQGHRDHRPGRAGPAAAGHDLPVRARPGVVQQDRRKDAEVRAGARR